MQAISCIVPAYNCERFVERALDSVFGQSVPVDEVIVVDDGSTDGTAQVLDSYADTIRVLRQPNAGPAAARNRGVEAATGDLICFQDADDEWLPQKLEKQLACLDAHAEADACITHIRNVWDESLRSQEERLKDHPFAQDPAGFVFPALLAHRHVFERVGPLDEERRRAEDVDWYARARDAGVVIEVVSEVLVIRYLHGDNLSAQGETTAERHAELLDAVAARLFRNRVSE